ncbi:uncharacterized protein V3H82_022303 [Fundulus diaphanus]
MTMYRKAVEISFTQRIREVEDRFSCDQESAAERFQVEIFKLEQHYQSELKSLSESHGNQKLHWQTEMQKVLEDAEEQRKTVEEAVEQERERCNREWENERRELENDHAEEIEALKMEIRQLQSELEDVIMRAQSKEIELSMQLNELHSRLQEKHQLLAQSEERFLQTELLLSQTVDDFKQERAELLRNNSGLQAKCSELISHSEGQVAERIGLLTERDDLQVKVEELEALLKQAALDFELERREMLESLVVLEKKLRDTPEVDIETSRAERGVLKSNVKELQVQQEQILSTVNETTWKESNDVNAFIEKQDDESSRALSDQDEDVSERLSGLASIDADQDCDGGDFATIEDQMDEQDRQDEGTENQDIQTEDSSAFNEGRTDDKLSVPSDQKLGSESPDGYFYVEYKNKAVSPEIQGEDFSPLQAMADGKNKAARESRNQETKPQEDHGSCFRGDQQHHETVVGALLPEETAGDPAELSVQDAEINCLPNSSHDRQGSLDWDCENENQDKSSNDGVETVDGASDCESQECATIKLQALYNAATEENVLLHEKISLLQQKTEILESLLAHHGEKLKTGRQVLEENYKLKVQMLVLMEHVRELQVKSLKTADLQIRYDDCMCENAKLKEQNDALENRVWSLESRLNVFHDCRDQHASLVDEISRMRAENDELSRLLSELERQDELLTSDTAQAEPLMDEALVPLCDHLGEKSPAGTGVEDCCKEFEEQNGRLRRAIAELQDELQIINEATRAHR